MNICILSWPQRNSYWIITWFVAYIESIEGLRNYKKTWPLFCLLIIIQTIRTSSTAISIKTVIPPIVEYIPTDDNDDDDMVVIVTIAIVKKEIVML